MSTTSGGWYHDCMIFHVLIFIFLLVPSLLEGLGLIVDTRLFLLYFSLLPSIFYIFTTMRERQIKVPIKASAAFFLFLFFSAISTFSFSLDKQASFELLLFYLSCFLLFIFFYNHKKDGEPFIYYFLPVLGTLFTFYSFLIPFFKQKGLSFLTPIIEKQFVFPTYANHNHLGDFLGLLVLILSYLFFKKARMWFLPLLLFFFGVMIFSFSRSAYVAFFIVFIFMLFYFHKKISRLLLPFILFFLSLILFTTFIISIELTSSSPFFKAQTYIKTVFNVIPREPLSSHDIYLKQALISIQQYPFFGIGGNNFILASKKTALYQNSTDSVHSLFFQMGAEQGIVATLFFLVFVAFVLIRLFRFPTLPGFLFLYLLFNFQTDYTYHIYSFFLLFIILSSLSYSEKKEVSIPSSLYGAISTVLLAALVCILTSSLFVKITRYEDAIRWYPFNKEAYVGSIKKTDSLSATYIQKLEYIAPSDLNGAVATAEYYRINNNWPLALSAYEKIYDMNHYCSLYFIKNIYLLKKNLISQKNADQFLHGIVLDYQHIFASNALRKDFSQFCVEEGITSCPKIGWNE